MLGTAQQHATHTRWPTIALLAALLAALARYLHLLLSRGPYAAVLPWAVPKSEGSGVGAAHTALRRLLLRGTELGAQVVLFRNGAVLASAHGAQPYVRHRHSNGTLTTGFSTAKVVSALAVAMLVDRGRLNYSDPVRAHWPAFPRAECTIAQLLGHDAGLAWLDARLPLAALREPALARGRIEAQRARHPRRGRRGYHAITWGLLVDELVWRADARGRSLGRFVAEEIAAPLGISDHVFMGALPEAHEARVAPVRRPSRAYALLRVWLPVWLRARPAGVSQWYAATAPTALVCRTRACDARIECARAHDAGTPPRSWTPPAAGRAQCTTRSRAWTPRRRSSIRRRCTAR
jgi:CubicO group peptidase (beta-lactamase class C family)